MIVWVIPTLVLVSTSRAQDEKATPKAEQQGTAGRVYGEWRIRVRPDQGTAYAKLIEQSGLPLFREAGGRMVGWWTTAVGDLYEQVTIWEYDDMAAFERAGQFLSKNPAFARFVGARDPLLAGEESRFMRLAAGAIAPSLPEPASFVIHEIHRVPLRHRAAYLDYMTRDGHRVLKDHGFKPVGPFVVDVGRWTEITYLFRFESLAERERLMAQFDHAAPAGDYASKLGDFTEEITTRLLVPAPFAKTATTKAARAESTLPHREQIVPGVYAAGFSDRFHSNNCGWVALADETLLIDLPRGIPAREFLAIVTASTGKPARTLALTHADATAWPIVQSLLNEGITRVLVSPKNLDRLANAPGAVESAKLRSLAEPSPIGDATVNVEFLPFDDVKHIEGGAAVQLPDRHVVFAGPLCINGPRALLEGNDTALWIAALRRFEALAPASVVPGFGSWGGPEILARQRRFLAEIRRQVGYHIAQGRSVVDLRDQIHLPADLLVWMPYDTPRIEDFVHVFWELSTPQAPFNGRDPISSDARPHALVLIGDQPHEPGHIDDGLQPAFKATGVVPHFAVDVKTLCAENLDKVQLLVILRDGLQRPQLSNKGTFAWMTPEQERAVVAFVEKGGGFLNLHNAMGLYPDGGPYLNLLGGRYIGHGPLERFRVEVVDNKHPVTRGVSEFFTADEQHTPPCDEKQVHVLLRNRSDLGKTAAAGWVREVGRGRLCHLANGHTRESLLHPMCQRLLANAIRWCLRLDDNATIETGKPQS
jgi:type 1 glutamine amidotransferase